MVVVMVVIPSGCVMPPNLLLPSKERQYTSTGRPGSQPALLSGSSALSTDRSSEPAASQCSVDGNILTGRLNVQ